MCTFFSFIDQRIGSRKQLTEASCSRNISSEWMREWMNEWVAVLGVDGAEIFLFYFNFLFFLHVFWHLREFVWRRSPLFSFLSFFFFERMSLLVLLGGMFALIRLACASKPSSASFCLFFLILVGKTPDFRAEVWRALFADGYYH